MDQIEDKLAERALQLLKQIPENERLLIAIAGSPGSGKSTLSKHITAKINRNYDDSSKLAVTITQDGFHYYRSELAKFDNAEEAFKRRGAPFTFDSFSFYELVRKLREPITDNSILLAPDFDHKAKDPIPNSIAIMPWNRIIFIEGNYTLLKDDNWNQIAKIVDERWKINIDEQLARKRVIQRHLKSGVSNDFESALQRYLENDLVNAEYINANSCTPDITIQSVDDVV